MKQMDKPLNILVVEDEMLIAMDIIAIVEDCGQRVLGEAATLKEVSSLPADPAPDVAFVDIHLAEGDSGFDVSAFIQRRWADTLIIFVTANPLRIPSDFGGAHAVISKPFTRNGLVSALQFIERHIQSPPAPPMPDSMKASPAFSTRC